MKKYFIIFLLVFSSIAHCYDHRDYSFSSIEDLYNYNSYYNDFINTLDSINDIILMNSYSALESENVNQSYPLRNIIVSYYDKYSRQFQKIEQDYLDHIKKYRYSNLAKNEKLIANKELNDVTINSKCFLYKKLNLNSLYNTYYIEVQESKTLEYEYFYNIYSLAYNLNCMNRANITRMIRKKLQVEQLKLFCDDYFNFIKIDFIPKVDNVVSHLINLTKKNSEISDKDYYLYKKLIIQMSEEIVSYVASSQLACNYRDLILKTKKSHSETLNINISEFNNIIKYRRIINDD